MVKPGGTGSPAFVISDSPAPLPPSRSFILPLPSGNKYTHLWLAAWPFWSVPVAAAGLVAVVMNISFVIGREGRLPARILLVPRSPRRATGVATLVCYIADAPILAENRLPVQGSASGSAKS